VERASAAAFDGPVPGDVAGSTALALAAAYVKGADTGPSFLPPKVQPWQKLLSGRMSARKLAWAGGAAAAVASCVALAFGIQQWQISNLETEWDKMAPRVNDLQADQDQIKKFRSWYDRTAAGPSHTGMKILRKLWESFPDDGSVSAKTIEVRDLSSVTCAGVASGDAAFLKLHANLSKAPEISDLHSDVRGQKPLQFSLAYQWGGGVNASGE